MDLGSGGTASSLAGGRSEALLTAIADTARTLRETEAERLLRIVEWAEEHTVASVEEGAATIRDCYVDTVLPIAGEGAPLVSEFALIELSATLGRSTGSGREYVGKIVELAYRLPLHWRLVQAGRLEPWRALAIADKTRHLPEAAASYVDHHLERFAATCTWAQISEPSRPRASAGCVGRGGRVSPARASLRARATGASRPGPIQATLPNTASWTCPTPSTWRPRSPTSPGSWASWAARTPWTCAGRRHSASWPAASSPST